MTLACSWGGGDAGIHAAAQAQDHLFVTHLLANARHASPPLGSVAGLQPFRRRCRALLLTDAAQSKATNVLDGISWREFEMLAADRLKS